MDFELVVSMADGLVISMVSSMAEKLALAQMKVQEKRI
jgi:hypothetical protein